MFSSHSKTLLLYTLLFIRSLYSKEFIIQLSTGKIHGKELNATYSPFGIQTAHVYLGVPYAKPPLGDLRFRKTVPVEKWNGILETKQYKPACLSNAPRTYKNTEGGPISEDCLYLNVFTNDFCMMTKNCSVMVVVHGGSFVAESGSAFNPEIMINNFVGQGRNIVVVTVNYRLGVFGFGHLNGEYGGSADHNIALYDLIETLKWTNREISRFGGSADRITAAGHSAGATAVFYLVSSPLSKGLVHQQIIMSAPISLNTKIGNTKATRATAVQAGCLGANSSIGILSEEDIKNTFDCLRRLDGKTLIDAQLYITSNTSTSFSQPYVDGEIVVDYLDNIVTSGNIHKVNTLIGTVTGEIRDTLYIQDSEGNVSDKLLENFCSHLGWRVAFKDPISFVKKCQEVYSKKNLPQFLSDDLEFFSSAIKIANSYLDENTDVYLYSFSYDKAGLAFDKYMPTVPSPTHSEDLIYVFGTHRKTMQPKDYVIERIYSGVFANFVNNGDPSPSEDQKWAKYTKNSREYFHIDFDEKFRMPGMKKNYYERAHNFWNVEIPQIAGPVIHMERFPPSFDVFLCSTAATAIDSHLQQVSTSRDQSLEVVEIGYYENEQFLEELKMEYVIGNITNVEERKQIKKAMRIEYRSGEGSQPNMFNIILLVSAAILMVVMLYVAATRWLLNRKRNGYQTLN